MKVLSCFYLGRFIDRTAGFVELASGKNAVNPYRFCTLRLVLETNSERTASIYRMVAPLAFLSFAPFSCSVEKSFISRMMLARSKVSVVPMNRLKI